MPASNAPLLSAIVEKHGVAFEVRAAPPAGAEPISAAEFQKYVGKLTRMLMGLSRDEVEVLRDELLIIDSLGGGVRLDALAKHHPMSISAAASASPREAAQVTIRAFDPVLRPPRS